MNRILVVLLLGLVLAQYELNPIEESLSLGTRGAAEPGDKNKILSQLTHLDSTLVDVVWCGTEGQVIVLSEKGSVYTSKDKGLSWKKKTEDFQRQAFLELDEDEKTGTVQKIMLSPIDSQLVLFVGSDGINWKSRDCGETVTAMNHGRKVSEFQFHPFLRDHLLAVAWSRCEDYDDAPCKLTKELYHSTDLGESWDLIEDYVIQFQWGCVHRSFVPAVPASRIVLAHLDKGKGHQNVTRWSKEVQLSYSDDYFKTKKTILKHGNKFLLTKHFFFVVEVVSEAKQKINLMVASPKPRGAYAFQPTEFPFGSLKDTGYTIVDSSSSSVFLNVNHQGDNAKYGHLYSSDEKGQKFSLTLANNARDSDGTCDFEKVLSLDGIYLSNFYLSNIVQKYRKQEEPRKMVLEAFKQTRITFSNGGTWQAIPAPAKDSKGEPTRCLLSDGCSLHFHTVTSSDMYGSFYSSEKAIGLIMAVGNPGKHLSNQKGSVHTYLSRDGGRIWKEVRKGSHVYEIGDHGGLLVMASDENPTNTLLYSWNEGTTWNSLIFSSMLVQVTNIVTESDNSARVFLIYGKDPKDQGVVVTVDFSEYMKVQCKGQEIPSHESSDYELWNINAQTDCLLGQKESTVRRKLDSFCYNGAQFEKKLFRQPCKCTELDYECDIGYSRVENGPCKLTNSSRVTDEVLLGMDTDYQVPQIKECHQFYSIPSGYRKIPGTHCQGGLSYEPVQIPCPKELNQKKEEQASRLQRRFMVGLGILLLILLLLYFKYSTLKQNLLLSIQNLRFILNRRNFDYSKFENDEAEMDFSKMVFEDHQEEPEMLQ